MLLVPIESDIESTIQFKYPNIGTFKLERNI